MVSGIVCVRTRLVSGEVLREFCVRETDGRLSAQQEPDRVTWVRRRQLGQRPFVRVSTWPPFRPPTRRPSSDGVAAGLSPNHLGGSLDHPVAGPSAQRVIVEPNDRPTVRFVAHQACAHPTLAPLTGGRAIQRSPRPPVPSSGCPFSAPPRRLFFSGRV